MRKFKLLSLLVLTGILSFGQTIFGFDPATVTAFDNAYWGSQPPQVQALRYMDPGLPARYQLCVQLSGQGFFVDLPVMGWNWDGYMTMYMRQVDGYSVYPDATGTKSRPVDLNPNDYPPFTPPPPPPPPGFKSLVGIDSGAKYVNAASPYNGLEMYNINPGTNNSSLNPGDKYTLDPRGTFVKIVNFTPFGAEIFFVLTN